MENYGKPGVSPKNAPVGASEAGTSSGVPLPGKPRARKLRDESHTSIRCIGPKWVMFLVAFWATKMIEQLNSLEFYVHLSRTSLFYLLEGAGFIRCIFVLGVSELGDIHKIAVYSKRDNVDLLYDLCPILSGVRHRDGLCCFSMPTLFWDALHIRDPCTPLFYSIVLSCIILYWIYWVYFECLTTAFKRFSHWDGWLRLCFIFLSFFDCIGLRWLKGKSSWIILLFRHQAQIKSFVVCVHFGTLLGSVSYLTNIDLVQKARHVYSS